MSDIPEWVIKAPEAARAFRDLKRNVDQVFKTKEELVYEVSRMVPGSYRAEILAMTSKASAQKLIAQLAEQQGRDRYRVQTFEHADIPGLER